MGARLPFRVPRCAAEMTTEWLTKVFQYRGYLEPWARVTSVEIKPIGEGLGVMGDLVFVAVKCENGGDKVPKRFIAKFSPQSKAPLPSIVIRAIFSTEAHWYNDFLVEDGGLPRPIAYLTAAKLRRRRWWRRYPVFCMLLEQLPPPPYSRVSGCASLPALQIVMESLASLHSRWWGHEKAPPLEWVTHPTKDFFGLLYNGFVLTTKIGLKALQRTYSDAYAPVLAWLPEIKRRHRYILSELFRPPLTLCHGDFHLDNLFFDPDFDRGIKVIDFGNMMFSQVSNALLRVGMAEEVLRIRSPL